MGNEEHYLKSWEINQKWAQSDATRSGSGSVHPSNFWSILDRDIPFTSATGTQWQSQNFV